MTVYHYTGLPAIKGIVASGFLRAGKAFYAEHPLLEPVWRTFPPEAERPVNQKDVVCFTTRDQWDPSAMKYANIGGTGFLLRFTELELFLGAGIARVVVEDESALHPWWKPEAADVSYEWAEASAEHEKRTIGSDPFNDHWYHVGDFPLSMAARIEQLHIPDWRRGMFTRGFKNCAREWLQIWPEVPNAA